MYLDRVYAEGSIVDIPRQRAALLVRRGLADHVEDQDRQVPQIAPEQRPYPTVSAICPTRARPDFLRRAIYLFEVSKHAFSGEAELIVVYDQPSDLPQDIPAWVRTIKRGGTVGEKRNIACEAALGEVILHWDDDDWYGPYSISHRVEALGDRDVAGYGTVLFHRIGSREVYRYSQQNYVVGASLIYRKEWWGRHRFRPYHVGEDNHFVHEAAAKGRFRAVDGTEHMVASIHPGNVSPRKISGSAWIKASFSDLPEAYTLLCQNSQ